MSRILVPSEGPHAWKRLLAKPDLHWATGYSARTMAHAWEAVNGFPPEIEAVLHDAFGKTDLLLAIPEHKTPLPGGRRESQSDVFALGRHATGVVACAIEGKVDEPFGPTVAQQMADASPGKIERFNFLCSALGLQTCPPEVHYQLLHRTVSALIEAERFNAGDAAMLVHSFSPSRKWFEEFERFCHVLGFKNVEIGRALTLTVPIGRRLSVGWVPGDAQFRLR